MRYLTRSMLAFSMLLASSGAVLACELPAHPNAAAMPVGITLRGTDNEVPVKGCSAVKLIQGTNDASFYYLIPEGSKVKLRIVWDPVCHNNPNPVGSADFTYKAEQYDYVYSAELKIKEDTDIGKVGGFYFFPLKTMSEYFTLNGNRKDAHEAFTREYGIDNQKEIISDKNLGPAAAFSASFATTGANDLGFSIVDGNGCSSYPDSSLVGYSTIGPVDGIDGIDSCLPGAHRNFKDKENDIFLLEEGKVKLVSRSGESSKPTWGFYRPSKADGTDDEDNIIRFLPNESGIEMSNMDFGLEEPKPENYKAYILENGNKKAIHVEGIGYDKDDKDAAHGQGDDCSFHVTFTTPSIAGDKKSANESDAIVKIMVNSPPAGYRLSNLFWVWEEQAYKRVKTGKYELAEDSELPTNLPSDDDKEETSSSDPKEDDDSKDDDSKDDTKAKEGTTGKITLDATDEKVFIYEKSGKVRKCSAPLVIVVSKTQDGVGYAAYKIYDDCGPITSDLVVKQADSDSAPEFFEEDKNTESVSSKFEFSIDVVDSNPYFAKNIEISDSREKSIKGGVGLDQNPQKMDLCFFYNYPVYDYKVSNDKAVDSLKGLGIVDFPESNKSGKDNKFCGYTHDTKWMWQKAEKVDIQSVELVNEIHADSGMDSERRIIGSVNRIKGTFEITNPKPWHETSNANGDNFSVFALFKDTSGNTHMTDTFKVIVKKDDNGKEVEYEPIKSDSAMPKNMAEKNYAMDPTKDTINEILSNTTNSPAPHFATDLVKQATWAGNKYWQTLTRIESKDETAPEIQVIVLDTRTNRYHIFGTTENVAGALNGMKNRNTDKTYSKLAIDKIPYINKNTAITDSYKYEKFDDVNALFTTYLQGEKAVSTVFDATNKNGFVCQKNSRLIFYPRAFDNIGYMDPINAGVQSFKATLYDSSSSKRFEDKEVTKMEPIENVFRQENVDNGNNVTPYVLKIEATDYANNTREFYLNIAVTGRTLDIRTLEEKRERINNK